MADNAVPRPQILAFTKEITRAIRQQIRPLEDWGVLPYFDILTESQLGLIKEATWA
jgi:hypothetical protein